MLTHSPKLEVVIDNTTERLPEMFALLGEHWEEVAKNKSLMVLNPHVEAYEMLAKGGALLSLYAYADDILVGYSVNFIHPHLHYKDLIYCSNDVLFVAKEYRDKPLGLRLIRDTEKAARERGAKLMLWHAKENTSLDKILPRMKYNVQDIIYSKEL